MPPVSYSIFWVDGSPDGLWVAGRAGWTGVGLVCPKTTWPKARDRTEFSASGVYLLISSSPEYQDELYIGEADVLRDRLNNHCANREWLRLIAFASKDGSLNKAHVKYLESRLIELVKIANRAHLQNAHTSLPPKLSEVDAANVDNFLAEMLHLYRLLGVNAFTPIVEKHASPSVGIASGSPVVYLKSGLANARGQETAEGFAVYEAKAQPDAMPGLQPAAAKLRSQLIESGVLVPDGESLRLDHPYLFGSPSLAASVLRGFNMNGPLQWKDEHGISLKERQLNVAHKG